MKSENGRTLVAIVILGALSTPAWAAENGINLAKYGDKETFCKSGLAVCFRPDSRVFYGIRLIADVRTWLPLSPELDLGIGIANGFAAPVTTLELALVESWVGFTVGYISPMQIKLKDNSTWITRSQTAPLTALAGFSIGISFAGGAMQLGYACLFIDQNSLIGARSSVPLSMAYISFNAATLVRQIISTTPAENTKSEGE